MYHGWSAKIKGFVMYKKVEEYCYCDIYKHIDAGVWVSAFDGSVIASGSYMKVKKAAYDFLVNAACR